MKPLTYYDLYNKAARYIVNGGAFFSCGALWKAGHSLFLYKDYFMHDVDENNAWWNADVTDENQLTRSLALLFMAEIEKDLRENQNETE
jgi:hypothetical protein